MSSGGLILTVTVADYIVRLALNFFMGYYSSLPHIHYSAICTQIECCHFYFLDFVLCIHLYTIKAFSSSTSASCFKNAAIHAYILNIFNVPPRNLRATLPLCKSTKHSFWKRFLASQQCFLRSFVLTSNSVIKLTRCPVVHCVRRSGYPYQNKKNQATSPI